MTLNRQFWAKHQGSNVYQYTLENAFLRVDLSNYGGLIKDIRLKRDGEERSIVLSYTSFEDYVSDEFYLGTVVGRCANRINRGIMHVGDQQFRLSINEPLRENHLHGGFAGFNKKVFDVVHEQCTDQYTSVTFRYVSPHLEEGYPGNCEFNVSFILQASGELRIRYQASADRDTHLNFTHHTYFNLQAGDRRSVAGHQLLVRSSKRLEMNERYLPTGQIANVSGTPFDFRSFTAIGEAMQELNGGFNMYYVFDQMDGGVPQVELRSGETNPALTLRTSLPGMMLYTGDYLHAPFVPNAGLCLETQFPPDACNHPSFPSTFLKAGNQYDHYTSFQFNWSQ